MNRILSQWALPGLSLAIVLTFSLLAVVADDEREREKNREAFGAELKAAVRAGKLSEAEALEKWEVMQDRWRAQEEEEEERYEEEGEGEEHGEFMEGVAVALETAVEMGKLSEREAEQVWREIEEMLEEEEREERREREEEGEGEIEERYRTMSRGLQAAVRLGKLSEEEAEEMWQDLTAERRSEQERAERRKLFEMVAEGLEAAVELGKIDEEEAGEMWRKFTEDEDEAAEEDEEDDDER